MFFTQKSERRMSIVITFHQFQLLLLFLLSRIKYHLDILLENFHSFTLFSSSSQTTVKIIRFIIRCVTILLSLYYFFLLLIFRASKESSHCVAKSNSSSSKMSQFPEQMKSPRQWARHTQPPFESLLTQTNNWACL